MDEKTRIWNMRIDAETDKRLNTLAQATERSASGMVRWLINEAWESHLARRRVRITESGLQALNEARESSTAE